MDRIDQVPGTARMNHQARPRQMPHEQARAAGVIEMDVGRNDEVDRVALEPGGGERREQARHRVVGAGVDERGAAALDDQIRGVEQRPVKAGVDDADAVRQRSTKSGVAIAAKSSITGRFAGGTISRPILESAFRPGTRRTVQNLPLRTLRQPEMNS
jgi:hypothetical protein